MKMGVKRRISNINRDAFLLTFGKVLVLGISLASSMLLSRFRTLNEYGTFSQITTIVSVVSTIFVLGLPNCINYFLGKADNDEEKDLFLCNYYKIMSILTIVSGIVLLVFVHQLEKYYKNDSLGDYWFCLLILPWATITVEGASNMLVASKKTKRLIIFNLLRSLMLLSIIIIIKFIGSSFFVYMILYVIVDAVFASVVYLQAFLLLKKYRFGLNKKMIKEIFIFSIPIGISSVLSTLNIKLDHLVVGRFFTTEELAIFSNAATELPFTVIASSFTAVLMPRLVRLFKDNKDEKALFLWHKVIVFNAFILFFCCIICVMFAPYIIKIIYSDKYIPGSNIFKVYSLILLLRITYFGMILNAKGKPKFILISSIISLALNLGLNILFVKLFGMIGAAIATVISIALIQFLQLFLSSRVLKISFARVFPWIDLLKIGFVSFSFYTLLNGVIKFFDLDYSIFSTVIVVIIIACFTLTYFVICFKPMKAALAFVKDE